MIPKPPNWIRINITIFPNKVQCAKVSTTTSPVTQTDVVAVNIAVNRLVCSPGTVEKGNHNRMVPIAMAIRKLIGMILAEVALVFFFSAFPAFTFKTTPLMSLSFLQNSDITFRSIIPTSPFICNLFMFF